MKKVILRYGAYAALFEFIFFVLVWLFLGLTKVSHDAQGTIGFVVITLPLFFVYFGIRYYRDRVNNGSVTFLTALKIGMLIVTIPAVAYAFIETVYVLYIDPKFYENIGSYQIEEYRKTLPPAAFAAKVKEIKEQLVIDNKPLFNFSMMILIIGALGSIVTLLSSALLARKAKHVNPL
ncbi:MAG TPA: DUF4199 domain-containing protein [Mucilaginibacter sp.]|jgi:hypothetical protein